MRRQLMAIQPGLEGACLLCCDCGRTDRRPLVPSSAHIVLHLKFRKIRKYQLQCMVCQRDWIRDFLFNNFFILVESIESNFFVSYSPIIELCMSFQRAVLSPSQWPACFPELGNVDRVMTTPLLPVALCNPLFISKIISPGKRRKFWLAIKGSSNSILKEITRRSV